MKWLALALAILGLLAGAAAIIYFTVPAHSLPSVLGPVACPKKYTQHFCDKLHRQRRGEAAAVAAGVLLVLAGVVFYLGRRAESAPAPAA
jgi:uncharacterized membrane protein HdeD (DUF308 family)